MPVRVADVMHRGLVTCRPDTSLADAARLLAERRIHALVVAGERDEPVGVLADFDLLAGEWLATDEERLRTMRSLRAADLMSAPPLSVDAETPAAEAAGLLLRERVARLLVTEDGRAVGVVSVSDLVATLAARPEGRVAVSDVMSRGFVACRADAGPADLARAMTDRRSRSVVVLDHDGTALGVVTGTDLLPLLADGAGAPTARELMREPLTVGPEAPLHEAAAAMVAHEVHRLVVVDEAGRPLGIVSTSDLLAEMAAPGSAWRL